MNTYTFCTRVIEGEPPEWVTEDTLVFVAPRPLLGTPREVTGTGWAGEVSVERGEYRADDFIDHNHRMDANLVRWVTRDTRLAQARAAILRLGYTEAELDELTDDEILMSAPTHDHEEITIEVDR